MMQDQLDEQLRQLFTEMPDCRPPAVQVYRLQQQQRRQEQNRLLLVTSFLSFCCFALSFLMTVLLLEQDLRLGMGAAAGLLISVASAGLLAGAILQNEQQNRSATSAEHKTLYLG